jgi:hypothetical protein
MARFNVVCDADDAGDIGLPRPEPPPPFPEYTEDSPEDSDEEFEVDLCFFKTISARAKGVPGAVVVALLTTSSPSPSFDAIVLALDMN